MTNETIELDERAWIEQLLEAFAREELPALALSGDSSVSSSSQRSLASVVSWISATVAEPNCGAIGAKLSPLQCQALLMTMDM